jgi:hypothetical protein
VRWTVYGYGYGVARHRTLFLTGGRVGYGISLPTVAATDQRGKPPERDTQDVPAGVD